MSKEQYREYFKKLQKYIKFTPIMEKLGIPRTNFSTFMNGNDSVLSIERLEVIKKAVKTIMISNITE